MEPRLKECPFRVTWMPHTIGVAAGQRAAAVITEDYGTYEEAMTAKDRPKPEHRLDQVTRGSHDVVIWPRPELSGGDAVWIDESTEGGEIMKGTLVGFLGFTTEGTSLWNVRLDRVSTLVPVPEVLLRAR